MASSLRDTGRGEGQGTKAVALPRWLAIAFGFCVACAACCGVVIWKTRQTVDTLVLAGLGGIVVEGMIGIAAWWSARRLLSSGPPAMLGTIRVLLCERRSYIRGALAVTGFATAAFAAAAVAQPDLVRVLGTLLGLELFLLCVMQSRLSKALDQRADRGL